MPNHLFGEDTEDLELQDEQLENELASFDTAAEAAALDAADEALENLFLDEQTTTELELDELLQNAELDADFLDAENQFRELDLEVEDDELEAAFNQAELDADFLDADFAARQLDEEFAQRPIQKIDRSVQNTRKKIDKSDWRVRLRLAPQSDYFYNGPDPGIMQPLSETDGVLFPYLPKIDQAYHANYSSYDLTHSNYRGYFYKNSYVGETLINATFTAQDTREANYMLAVIQFFRSVTKMFYGQDELNGTPPPLVYLTGLGDFQFNEHPCAVSLFNYNLPNDVDYIKAGDPGPSSVEFLQSQKPNNPKGHAKWSSRISRLFSSGLSQGAETPLRNTISQVPGTIGSPVTNADGITYVPTKLDIAFQLLPIQTRDQVSNKFSLKDYASGKLVKKGFY
jgi:hypothetical protein